VSDLLNVVLSRVRNESVIDNGLNAGANDYVTRPFSARKLLALLKSHLRSISPRSGNRRINTDGNDLIIDLAVRKVSRAGEELRLSPVEPRRLACLVENSGSVVSHDALAAAPQRRPAARLAPHPKFSVRRLRQEIELAIANPQAVLSRHDAGCVIAAQTS
jgi:two-component system KDP operon response regulator KdpE